MAVEIATVGALAALIMPVYAALWTMNRKIGRIAAKTEHNETALESVSGAVERLEARNTRVDTRYHNEDARFAEAADS